MVTFNSERQCLIENLWDIEKKLSKQLRGKRLICEASFNQKEIEVWLETLISKDINAWAIYPTLSAVTTVGTGIYKYNGGDLWSAFPGFDSPTDRTKWGKMFINFIERHESLEDFRNLKGLRYVSRILAHGGIPQYCLPDFFTLLVRHGDPDQPSADFIEYIRKHETNIANIDKPVERFLIYGGEVAEELVARCLALWLSHENGDGGGTHGLPKRVINAFAEWYTVNAPDQRTLLRQLPKPQIRISVGDLWVYLYLPRCENHPDIGPNACWVVNDKEWAVTREHQILLHLSNNWTINCKEYQFVLNGINEAEPVMFFDPTTCKLIPDPSIRRLPEHLWAVLEQSLVVEPEPIHKESIPTWQNHIVAVLDLSGHTHVKIGEKQYDVRRPFFQIDKDPIVVEATTETGLPIFYKPPKIEWEGEANFSLIRHGRNEGNINITSKDFQILFDEPGHYEFYLRGPLGQNVHKNFVMISGFRLHIEPPVMWPNIQRLECSVTSDSVDIYTLDGRSSPFKSHVPFFRLKAFWDKMETELLADTPTLRWRVLMSNKEVQKWDRKPITLSVKDIEKPEHPRLVCKIGKIEREINIFLISRHGAINSPQSIRCAAAFQQDVWTFDLRMVLDQARHSGLSEEFDISVQATDGRVLYRGPVMTVRPEWDLQNFNAAWKKKDEGSAIRISWKERGSVISGRWLTLSPLWRPWEGVTETHQLSEEERTFFEWHLLDIRPGRYIVRAAHAPWGCEDWGAAQYLRERIIDIDMENLGSTFEHEDGPEMTIEGYFEHLLAHWYRPQQIKTPPKTPLELTSIQVGCFLKLLNQTNTLSPLKIPRDNSGSLSLFYLNPQATTDCVTQEQELPSIWKKILPSREVILLNPEEKDRAFIREIAFQFTVLSTAAKSVKSKHKRKYLSAPLQEWHRNLPKKPSPDEVIFLCEKFGLFSSELSVTDKQEYEKLKAIYKCKEAI